MTDTQPIDEAAAEGCAGGGAPAVDGSVLQEAATRKTGVCPSCGGRFRLGSGARLPHHAAEASTED